MRDRLNHTVALSALAGLLAGAVVVVAGPLQPPAGAPQSTHKTLNEVEPRIAVNADNTPGSATAVFTIDSSGSYYLTSDVMGEDGKVGIEINAQNVTLDLSGFTVQGVNGALTGILSTRSRTVIRNGNVINWGGLGVNLTSFDATVERVIAFNNGMGGIGIGSGAIRECTANQNFEFGISADHSAIIEDSRARFTFGGTGILVGNDSIVTNCVSSGSDTGISAGAQTMIIDCVVSGTVGDGVAVTSNSTVRGCTVRASLAAGISGEQRNLLEGNHVFGGSSSSDGYHLTGAGNRLDRNFASSCDRGFRIAGTNNLLTRNTSTGNNQNYNIAFGNFARVVAATPTVTIIGDSGGAAVAPEDPWINMAY